MKPIFLLAIAVLASVTIKAQTVYSTKYKSDAQVKVYVVQYQSDADLIVYKAQYKSDAGDNNGVWYFTEYSSDAKKRSTSRNTRAMPTWSYILPTTKAMPAGKTGASSN